MWMLRLDVFRLSGTDDDFPTQHGGPALWRRCCWRARPQPLRLPPPGHPAEVHTTLGSSARKKTLRKKMGWGHQPSTTRDSLEGFQGVQDTGGSNFAEASSLATYKEAGPRGVRRGCVKVSAPAATDASVSSTCTALCLGATIS